jgi:phage tail sheath protein FI
MPQYLAPGVYVEEVPSGAAPIAGVGTSIGGFIGVSDPSVGVTMPEIPGQFEADPDPDGNPIPKRYELVAENDPQLITSWQQFTTKFGNFSPGNKILAHGVYGFFNNGGTRCWVTRIDDITNAATVETALVGFAAIDEITLVAVPGAQLDTVHDKIMTHCESMGDRFAVLDANNVDSVEKSQIQGNTRTSDYAAMYFPWIEVFDPVSEAKDILPPSGHMVGIYARVDTERGVHKAPANAVIRGATGVARRVSKADQTGLNPDGINIIRKFNGNVTVWGARTLGGDANTEWKYINVRRLFLFLRESIDEGTQWVVFEPNSPNLWSKITRNVTAFLTIVWRSGALFGSTPQEAFYVKCDAETNPPEVRDLGQVVTEIGVAVVKPAEFVIFRISQWAGPGG